MKVFSACLSVAVLSFAFTGTAAAQGGPSERDMSDVHCIRIGNLDNIDIVDSDTLVFRMRNGDTYQNELPHRCPGLRADDTLMYRSSAGQLCSIDIITVLEDRGFGFAPGASCGLGMFHPVTDPQADEPGKTNE